MEYIDPWIISAEGESLFPIAEKVTAKLDPIHHESVKKNGSFFDFSDNFESFIEPTIFTSSPLKAQDSAAKTVVSSPGNPKIVQRNKDIDIEALKMNVNKILSSADIEPRKQFRVKKSSNISLKKKTSSKHSSAHSDILFVNDSSLTMDDQEFEFSDNIVPKNNSSATDDSNILNIHDTEEVTKKKLRLSTSYAEGNSMASQNCKNISRGSVRKQKVLPASEIRECVEDVLPKKISETDNLIPNSKCNLQFPPSENTSNPQKKAKRRSKTTFKRSFDNKRVLRSSFLNHSSKSEKNSPENSTKNEDSSEKLIDCAVATPLAAKDLVESETEVSETPKNKLKARNSQAENKRVLRSASQDPAEPEKSPTSSNKSTDHVKGQNSRIMSDVKVALEKCKVQGDPENLVIDNSTTTTSPLPSPPKNTKSVPEITIILNPLDISTINEKLSIHSKNSFHEVISPTKRSLRSQKHVGQEIVTNPIEADSVNGSNTDDKKLSKDVSSFSLKEPIINGNLEEKASQVGEENSTTVNDVTSSHEEGLETNKTEGTSKILDKNEFASKSLTSIESVPGKAKPINKLRRWCSLESIDEHFKQKIEFATVKAHLPTFLHDKPNMAETELITEKIDSKKCNIVTNIRVINVTNSYLHLTNPDNNECCEVPQKSSPKLSISENEEAGQTIEGEESPRKSGNGKNDEYLKCNEEEQNHLDLSGSYKCSELRKASEQLEKHLLDSESKNMSDPYNSKVEKTDDLSDLLKKEEDKAVISTSLPEKIESPKYSGDGPKLLNEDIGTISEKISKEAYKNLDTSSDSQKILNEISDKTKIDPVEENSAPIVEDTIENSEVHSEVDNKTQGIDTELHDQKSENEKENNKISGLLETFLQTNNDTSSIPNEISSSKLNLDQQNDGSLLNTTPEIARAAKIVSNSNLFTDSDHRVSDKSEKIERHPGLNARLKEKRRKLLGTKAPSGEEPVKTSETSPSNESVHPPKTTENSPAIGASLENPSPSGRRRGRPRKSRVRDSQLEREDVSVNSRGRPSRRQSVDDMDLLNRYKERYRERVQRSKSVARSVLEIRRKPTDEDRLETRRNWMDEMDLLTRYEKYYKDKTKTNVVQNIYPTRTSLNNMNTTKNTGSWNDCSKVDKELVEVDVTKNENVKKVQGVGNPFGGSSNPVNVDFKVGDVTWAHIGCFPYWPCLITKEPGTKHHVKLSQRKDSTREIYHVRFFGDKGRRAWIHKRQIMLYSSSDDLRILRNKMKFENKMVPSAYVVKSKTLQKWQRAVEEAEQVKLKTVKEKLLFFTDMFSKTNSPKKSETLSDVTELKNGPVSIKRKFNEHNKSSDKCESPLSKEIIDEISQRKKKRKLSSENERTDEIPNQEEVIADLNAIQQIEDHVRQNEHILTRIQLRRQIDEISDIGSKTSSDNITDSDTSLNSMETQKALYKRNNLFRGISRDKVCQYCWKPGDVLKCRGRCNGSYHAACSLKILQETTPRKKREKNDKKHIVNVRKLDILRNTSTDKPDSGENTHCSSHDAKLEHGKSQKSTLIEEDQVQIITVPSSVYNTPPRKTFPPDFKNMTLAEQIDYKMKEIMRKFESRTFYADSFSEASSEDNLDNQVLSQAIRLNTMMNRNKSNEKRIQEARASDGVANGITNISNDAHKATIANIEKSFKPITKKIVFFKHVTADSDSLRIETIVEEKADADRNPIDDTEPNPKNFKCGFCASDLYPYCFICHMAVSRRGSNIRQKCSIYPCGRFYHPECLKMWPQTQWSLIQTTKHKDSDKDMDSFVCPLHVCHTCVSDDPRAATSRCSGDKIVKCMRCPSTYHSSNLCLPAGTAIFSSSQVVCPRHREKSRSYTINTTWCFLCSKGGNLICCENCPTSVHPECLPVNLTDDDKFICEDCESGRLPLYDEIVWVKLGKFRWWPALILFPNEVPDNVRNMKHSIGEFVVKFFGTYDYYWVNRGRSFLFQDGDTGQCSYVKKKVDAAFNTAVEEAVVAHKLKKEFKLSQEVESISSLKPPPYIRIKVNKPVGNVRHLDLDLSSTNTCECDPDKPHPCGPESDCLNRLLLTECDPDMCPAGSRCKNQSFEKREYPPLIPYKTQGRGWGLKTLAPIKKGQFVIEYVGELIDGDEYQRRIQKMHEQKEENYYFLTIDKDRMIDAGPKGNAARFMNHCCQPNCETQKWTVNGDTRVGLFATEDIAADTELTFNYNLECVGKEKKVCRCGAPNCSGFIGVKAKQDGETRRPRKNVKKIVPVEPVVLPPCFVCGKGGLVTACNNKVCNKTYHPQCLQIAEITEGNKFICPWHNCSICSKRTIRCCVKCVNSYCPPHSDGNIRYDNLLGFVCTTHDPMTAPNDDRPIFKRRRQEITEDATVTSTTSDDVEDDEDWMPLLMRLERLKSKKMSPVDSENGNDLNVIEPSTSLSGAAETDYESQDEEAISTATGTGAEGEIVVVKRKRGRPRKRKNEKKIRLNNEENIGITASSAVVENKSTIRSSPELSSRHNNLENR